MKSNEKTRLWMKKTWATLIFNEKPWKNLDFHSKSAKNLEFLGFCAPRKQKNGKSYKMRPRRGTAGGRAPKGCAPRSGAQPFGANMWIQSLSRKMFSCKLENFFRSKNRTCVGPHRLGKFQKYRHPYNEKHGFWRFWAPQRGPRGRFQEAWGAPGASDKGAQLPGQAKQGKSWFLKAGGRFFTEFWSSSNSKLPGHLGWLQAALQRDVHSLGAPGLSMKASDFCSFYCISNEIRDILGLLHFQVWH